MDETRFCRELMRIIDLAEPGTTGHRREKILQKKQLLKICRAIVSHRKYGVFPARDRALSLLKKNPKISKVRNLSRKVENALKRLREMEIIIKAHEYLTHTGSLTTFQENPTPQANRRKLKQDILVREAAKKLMAEARLRTGIKAKRKAFVQPILEVERVRKWLEAIIQIFLKTQDKPMNKHSVLASLGGGRIYEQDVAWNIAIGKRTSFKTESGTATFDIAEGLLKQVSSRTYILKSAEELPPGYAFMIYGIKKLIWNGMSVPWPGEHFLWDTLYSEHLVSGNYIGLIMSILFQQIPTDVKIVEEFTLVKK